MKTKAVEKFIKISPTKVTRYAREIPKGMNVNLALDRLLFVNAKGAKALRKAIESAKANMLSIATTHNIDVDDTTFIIDRVSVMKAPTYRRMRPRGRGHADIIHKRNSHIVVEIIDGREVEERAEKTGKVKAAPKDVESNKTEARGN